MALTVVAPWEARIGTRHARTWAAVTPEREPPGAAQGRAGVVAALTVVRRSMGLRMQ